MSLTTKPTGQLLDWGANEETNLLIASDCIHLYMWACQSGHKHVDGFENRITHLRSFSDN